VLELRVEGDLCESKLLEAGNGRVTDDPVQCCENMPFHLGEHVVIVERAAHRLELADCRYTLLAVAVLGSNEQSRAADELVVALVDDALRAVTVEQVDGEVECLRQELEGVVGLKQEVKQIGAHEPLDFSLNLN